MGKAITSAPALIFRSAALFAILFQIRLIAADLADTSVFTAALLAGFAAAIFLSVLRTNGKPVNPLAAVISIGLIPWVGRALIAMPRIFIPDRTDSSAIILDSLLLNLDRNNFVSLFPYYWSAVSTWFSVRSRKFLRAAVIADAAFLLFLFSIAHTAKIELYRWPIVMIVMFASVVFLQALALLFSMPSETKLRVKEICFAITALFAIIVTGGYLFLKPIQEQAAKMGGGLLEPKFFSFGFSKYPKLDSEISTRNDLILIVKKDNANNFLRQLVLSGYNRKQGFYQIEKFDELTHPQRLPNRQEFFTPPEFEAARYSNQEYFLINFDSSAFIGMKEFISVTPYENWDTSSFNSAYAVESLVSVADFLDLSWSTSGTEHPTPEQLGLSESEYKIYTEYGNDERFRSLAEEITADCDSYADKVAAVYNFLKYGEYRYSLKPGIAPDGDQLGWFLFQAKRGYCSYYAFAMTLLLRSLGIPARIAAGFFTDTETDVFDYYPVRLDMAHAWVEAAFPKFGWIDFDPTTEKLAEDEEFQFSAGTDPALFEKLIREILENRSRMKARESVNETSSVSNFNLLTHNAISLLRNYWPAALAALLTVLFLYIRCGLFLSVFFTRNRRKKSIRLMKHACRRLRLAGRRRNSTLAESEWALRIDNQYKGIYSMYQSAAAARFAPEYSKSDFDKQRLNYKNFCTSYRREVPLWRRVAGWILPPLAIVLDTEKKNGKTLLIILLFLFVTGSQTRAQDSDKAGLLGADELYKEASDSDFAEYWTRAIELYREGGARFPNDVRFPLALGNLYYDRSLFGLAWDEYRKAEVIFPDNQNILIRLARTAGYLNRDSMSVDYYERALEIDPHNKEAIGNLGWMYFKVHRLADGERLLVSALELFGDEPDFSMTLGTIYSDMYRYDDSKFWYNKAISLGENIGDSIFTAIAWYNLSILESRFYRYELCMDATNASLDVHSRASGRLARGELFLRQLELEKAQKEYETAYGTDTSPLAKLNLAQVYQVSGRLEEARLYAEDCLKGSDNSWMLNFGIDHDRYKKDIHYILANSYLGLAKTERFLPWARPQEKIRSLFKTISYKLKYAVNIRLYRKYCLASANAYIGKTFNEDGLHLDSLIQYYNAFKAYPRRALAYLNMARAFETALIPDSIPSYDYEEGVLLDNENLVEQALYGFDPLWERELIAQCYGEFANPESAGIFSSRRRNQGRAAEELFAINRGALRQNGIKLPVQINLILSKETASLKKHLERALAAAGFKKAAFAAETRYTLTIKIDETQSGEYTASCEITDNMGEIKNVRHLFPLRAVTRAGIYDLVRALGNAVFTVE